MSYLVVVLGWDAENKLPSEALSGNNITVLSCPACPRSPEAYAGDEVDSGVSIPAPAEMRVLHFNTRLGAVAWRVAHADDLEDKIVLMDGELDDD